ncbi:MAG: hypothetical protein ACKVT1_05120 [Dehalococcoidia bacterium]
MLASKRAAGAVAALTLAASAAVALVFADGQVPSGAAVPDSEFSTPSVEDLLPIPVSSMRGEDLLDWVGPMASLEQIAKTADVVAAGRFIGIKGSHEIFPSAGSPSDNGHSTGVTFTLLVFEIDDLIKGEAPKQVVVRQTGDLAKGLAPEMFPAPRQGELMLVFLTREPFGDDTYASINGPYGRMRVEGGVLKYQGGGERAVVEYVQAKTLGEAIGAAKSEVARQKAQP